MIPIPIAYGEFSCEALLLMRKINKKMNIPWLPCSKKSRILVLFTDGAPPAGAGKKKKNILGIMGNRKTINPFSEKPK